MAIAIYVTSTDRFSGKTALCTGLLRRLRAAGHAAGYMKPVSTTPRADGGRLVDEDVLFVRSVMGLSDPIESMAPILLAPDAVKAVLDGGDTRPFEDLAIEAYRTIATGKDAVVIEGGGSLREGRIINLPPERLIRLFGARALVVVPYVETRQVVDDLLITALLLGNSLAGAIINSVFPHRLSYAEEKVRPYLASRGVPVLATLPKDKLLLSVSVGELLEGLAGEILCCEDALGELVENVMVGAMAVENALSYFRRSPHKAVITGGDRVDIQLAALETSTRCLILTGNLYPNPLIIALASERRVPLIVTRHDTLSAIQAIENFFGKTRFHQEKKVAYFERLLEARMDFDALSRALGIAATAPTGGGAC
ncbi:MAG: phosphotransacetylase family protein [Syntrophorhabdales bacterium]|jgi:BioD-like phosphotransacetylase family protein